jgi:hypothetical protein
LTATTGTRRVGASREHAQQPSTIVYALARNQDRRAAWRAAAEEIRATDDSQLRREIEVMLRLAQARPAIRVRQPATDSITEARDDHERLHRVWAAALFCRTIDAYDAVVRLHDARLDIDARAHSRIAFEHW